MEKKNMEEPLTSEREITHQHTTPKQAKGGLITMPFIIGTCSDDQGSKKFNFMVFD